MDAGKREGNNFVGAFYKISEDSYKRAVAWQDQYGGSIGKNDPTLYERDWYFDPATGYKYGVRTYDPFDYMIREWAPTQQHNLSLSGKTGKTSYNVGLGMLDQSGMLKTNTDQFSRYNASVRVTSEVNKYITARAGAIYSRTNKQYPYATNSITADPWLYMYRWSSLYPYGNDGDGDPIRSPAYETGAANVASQVKNYMNFNAGATVNFMKNWKLDFDYTLSNQEMLWNQPGTRFTAGNSWGAPVKKLDASGNQMYVDGTGSYVDASAAGAVPAYDLDYFTYTASGSNPDHYRRDNSNILRHTINAFSTYNLNLEGGHDFKFMLGLNRIAEKTESSWTQITKLLDIKNPQLTFGTGTVTGSGAKLWESQIGFFGRVNYAYKDKYLFEANLRRDGSSKFPTSLRWKWYPSVSAGWVVSQESFMDWSSDFMNQLKIRGKDLVTIDVDGKKMNKLSDPNGAYQTWVQNSATFLFGPGDVKFKDLNGDGRIDNGKKTLADHGDLKVIGNSTPRYEYGFRVGADFKGFDVSAFFQGVGSRQVWGTGFLAQAGFNSSDGAMPAVMSSNYWTEKRTDAFYPAPFNNAGTNDINNMQVQSRYLLDMSYLRVKNLTLGYTIPAHTLKRIGISNLRVYTALENFFTWDKLNGLPIDPEAVDGVNMFVDALKNNYNSGRTGVGTPTFKSASVGVQLTF